MVSNGLPLRQHQRPPLPSGSYTDGLCGDSASTLRLPMTANAERALGVSIHTGVLLGGGSPHRLRDSPKGKKQGHSGVYPLTQELPLGRLPHNTSESPKGCPRPADSSLRVPAGSPPPPPPLTGTVRVRDAGPGLADSTPRTPCRPWPLGSRRAGAERREQAARAEQQAEAAAAAARAPQAHPPSPSPAPRGCGACARARRPPRAGGRAARPAPPSCASRRGPLGSAGDRAWD